MAACGRQRALLERGWKIQERYRLSFWDAMVVAAANASGCRYLLTEDLQPDETLDGITVISPFQASSASIIGLE